mmetsp:Transcript_5212/g.11171  ORF Transcript_5212/g.11171 Transcript_5212/m.11171 type:complete len:471 (-) Transcript_5212:116-1528(-)
MGCTGSKEAFTGQDALTEADYKAAFNEEKTLGQGEFGVVKLVTKKSSGESFACKLLQKGFVFKDNTLYAPMKPEHLKMEIDILKALNGSKCNLSLDSVYESSSKIYVVTECCSGGEMLEYTSKTFSDGLSTDDVSRIAYQLLGAVDHCAKHNVIHRDIKPENVMFKSDSKTAELRLIDFGCATMDDESNMEHSTFAGTPFYISPEMFQKKYTTKCDVFSVGVLLYVLVAGYPATTLQTAFNLLHKASRDLKTLPGSWPEDVPETYFEMLDKLLRYRWKSRPSAGEMLEDDFVAFHLASAGKLPSRKGLARTKSVVLKGTGEQAAMAYGFSKFERVVTTLIATLLDRGSIISLLGQIDDKVSKNASSDRDLGVIKVTDLKDILNSMGKSDCVAAIEKQSKAKVYESYPYEFAVLKSFTKKPEGVVAGDSRTSKMSSSTAAMSMRNLNKSVGASSRFGGDRRSQMSKSMSGI